MGLKDINLKCYYNNDSDNLIEDFYEPVIRNSIRYDRATGFFASSSFWAFIDGLKEFINKNGRIRLLVSPQLSENDIEAIALGIKAKEDTIEAYIEAKILEDTKYDDQFNLLAWLIYENKLEMKIVVKKDFNNYGIFHDKFGFLEDDDGNEIMFHGSLNESETGINDNYESFHVFKSWNEYEKYRINDMKKVFNNLWENQTNKWTVHSISEGLKDKILAKRDDNLKKIHKKEFSIPEHYKLRDYQNDAISAWFKNNCSGILEMATGSGKTLTAIFAIKKTLDLLKSKGYPCGVVIVVPYKNLLEQWCDELKEFGVVPIRCYESKYTWYNKANIEVANFNKYDDSELFMITTNATYITESFQSVINGIKRNYVFCVDEMHHLTGQTISSMLPTNTDIKLGLTATLNNEYTDERVEKIKEYFNDIVYTFSLKNAIDEKCLTPYYYYPVIVDLLPDELEEYIELTRKISKLINNEDKSSEEILKLLINKRRKIIFNAENKIEIFKDMKSSIEKYRRALVYCGDKIDDDGKFVNKINKIINGMGIVSNTYTSELRNQDRLNVLNKFKEGEIKVLTAIRCLDEGVNIPSLDSAFILSSNMDSKQFIQRRGRILRKAENKEFAYIYDFIVVPSLDKTFINSLDWNDKKLLCKIVLNEMKRFNEFANLCENKIEALEKITEVLSMYL